MYDKWIPVNQRLLGLYVKKKKKNNFVYIVSVIQDMPNPK